MNSANSFDSDLDKGFKASKSPVKEFFKMKGVETRAKRIDRQLKENSRAIQCELLADPETK